VASGTRINPGDPGERSTASRSMRRTDAGGALGRESHDAGTVASDASIKAGEPGEALHREAFDADDVPRPSTWPSLCGH